MKALIFCILISCIVNKSSGQLSLTKKNKGISLDSNRVLSIKANSIILLSYLDYNYHKKIKKYPVALSFMADSIKKIARIGDTLKVQALIMKHYIDSVTGVISSTFEAGQHWNVRNKRVLIDTTFYFGITDIREIMVQTKKPNYEDGPGMAVVGMFILGTSATIVGTIEVLKGHPYGYLAIGGGLAFLGYMKYSLKKNKWFHNFKIGKKDWKIETK